MSAPSMSRLVAWALTCFLFERGLKYGPSFSDGRKLYTRRPDWVSILRVHSFSLRLKADPPVVEDAGALTNIQVPGRLKTGSSVNRALCNKDATKESPSATVP